METSKLSADVEKIRLMPLSDKKPYAKELYWQYTTITDISKTLDIKLPTIKSWIYGANSKKEVGWKVERELSKNQLLKDLSADKRGMVYNMVNGSLYLIHDFVEKTKEDVVKTGKKIDIRDADKLTNILMNLHKIVQEEKDNADDDSSFVKPTSPEELQQRAIKADPFADSDEEIIEAEVISSDDYIISEEDLK